MFVPHMNKVLIKLMVIKMSEIFYYFCSLKRLLIFALKSCTSKYDINELICLLLAKKKRGTVCEYVSIFCILPVKRYGVRIRAVHTACCAAFVLRLCCAAIFFESTAKIWGVVVWARDYPRNLTPLKKYYYKHSTGLEDFSKKKE